MRLVNCYRLYAKKRTSAHGCYRLYPASHLYHSRTLTHLFTGSIATFLQHLCQLYRQANTYHNLQHALDVFQAVYFFLTSAGAVPPVTILLEDGRTWKRDREASDPLVGLLTDEDLFALCIAAVGHDVGHPGLNNAFMVRRLTRYRS